MKAHMLHQKRRRQKEETKETADAQKSAETAKNSRNEEYLKDLQKQVPYMKLQIGYGLNTNNDGKVNVVDVNPKILIGSTCPFAAKYVPILEEMAKARNAVFRSVHIQTREDA